MAPGNWGSNWDEGSTMRVSGIVAITCAAVLGAGAVTYTTHAEIKGISIGQGNLSGDGTSGTPLPAPPSLPTLPGASMLPSLPGGDLLTGLLGAISIGQGNLTGDGTILPLPAPPSLPGLPSLPGDGLPSLPLTSLPTGGLPSLPVDGPPFAGTPSLPVSNLPTSGLPSLPAPLPPVSSSGQLNGLGSTSSPSQPGGLFDNWMFNFSGL